MPKKNRPGAPAPLKEPTTLAHVAAHAGVSISTVGRVLRGSSLPVAKPVAERVRDSAAQLGYVANLAARSLRGVRPAMVGLVVGDMLDPYYGEIAEVVTHMAESRHGMLAIVCNMQRDPQLELKYCRQLWEHRVTGLILAGGGFDQHVCRDELAALVASMQSAGLVVATLGPRFLDAPVFSVDNAQAGRLAAEQLLNAGHRHIGILTGSLRSETARQRHEGALEALNARRAKVTVRHAEFQGNSVATAAASLLSQSPGVTGILAGSDHMARAIINWLGAQGVAVPKDVSVIGTGNNAFAEPAPRLTTIDVHLAECARAALQSIASGAGGGGAQVRFEAPAPSVVAGATVRTLG
ncbi:MAG: LacI family DNA-binding transcriptional regulator [Burkholderiaceae bacterium]|nr:LacI family DNA-binding transcriptional regulator [Burkholderiaceae bacterium]